MLWVVLFCNLWQKRKIHLEKDCITNSIVKSSFTVWTKSLLSSGYISNASKNPGSNHHAQKEESRKTVMGRLWRMTIEPSIFMQRSYQLSCSAHHCPYTTPSSGNIALFLTRDECDTLLESLKIRLQQLLLTFSMKFKFFT